MTRAKVKDQPALFETRQVDPKATASGGGGNQPKRKAAEPAPKKNGTALVKAEPRPTNLLVVFANAAADPKCDPAKMAAISALVDKMKAEEAEVAFTEAYIDMQEELPSISATGLIEIAAKSGTRGQSTPYAKFDEIMRVVKPILRKHKFALMVVSEPNPSGVGVVVRGTLSRVHETQYGKAAHVKQTIIAVPLENSGSKNNVQGIGSSLSYAKRYAAIQLLNIISHAEVDDDRDGHGPKPKKGAAEAQVNDAEAMINGSQQKELLKEIDACGIEPTRFMEKYGIAAVHELPAKLYGEAIQSCRNYAAAKAKK